MLCCLQPAAPEAFKAAREAYEILSNTEYRAAYDRARLVQQRQASRSSSSYVKEPSQGSHVDYSVIYEYVDEDELNAGAPGTMFSSWYAQSGSWQSSWQANTKKQKAKAQRAKMEAQQQQQQQQANLFVQELLQQLDKQTLAVVQHVFGSQLQHLDSAEVRKAVQWECQALTVVARTCSKLCCLCVAGCSPCL
jgi:DnaJ-class molecular chaperone